MAIAWSDVVDIAPEMSTLTTAQQNAVLGVVNRLLVDTTLWGDRIDDGKKFLAAHIATIGIKRGGKGEIASETLGPASRSYATLRDINGTLGQSGYGAMYLELVRSVTLGGLVP